MEVIIFVSQNCLKHQMREHMCNMNMLLSIISHLHRQFPRGKAPFSFPVLWSISEVGDLSVNSEERDLHSYHRCALLVLFLPFLPHHWDLASPPFLFRKTTRPPWTTWHSWSSKTLVSLNCLIFLTSGINQGDPKILSLSIKVMEYAVMHNSLH